MKQVTSRLLFTLTYCTAKEFDVVNASNFGEWDEIFSAMMPNVNEKHKNTKQHVGDFLTH